MAVKKTPTKKETPAAPAKVEATESAPKSSAKPKAKKVAAAAAPAPEPTPEAKATKPKAKAPAAKAAAPKAEAKPVKAKAPAKAADAKVAAKAEPAAKPAAKAPAKKAAAPMKLTDSQSELLKKIGEAPEVGYSIGKKAEQRSIDALLQRKLIKKGAKDKASGSLRYQISSAGKKHLTP